ncbi:MAG: type III PLP-dependent enzyme [Acidobacteriia bacterium]|nr:type III PLP-dependent enzyme [Terriglobia bacterium]
MKSKLELSARLAETLFEYRNGTVLIHGLSVEDIAARHGTPFYLYDSDVFVRQYQRLRRVLPEAIDIYYSIKANPHPKVISIFVGQGAGCEIASGGEYARARSAGAAPERIVFAGPAKGREELEYVVSHGIGEIHLESFEEMETLERLAQQCNTTVDVSIRINPSAALGGGLLMGGQPTAFGFEEETLREVTQAVNNCTHLKLRGIHLYTGTQILDANSLLTHWQHAVVVGKQFADLVGAPVQTLDLGGGLGIPYFAHEQELDLDALANGARTLIDSAQADPKLASCRFMVEPGRFLTGPAGIYVARVRSVKACRGTTFVVLDGGMNHHLAASGNLGQVVRRDYPIVNLSRSNTADPTTVVIVGPLCTPIDTLGRKVTLSRPHPGDLIGILQSGAYGLTASPLNFLSHPTPAEVLVRDGTCDGITRRGVAFG